MPRRRTLAQPHVRDVPSAATSVTAEWACAVDTALDTGLDTALDTALGTGLGTGLGTELGTGLDTALDNALDTGRDTGLGTLIDSRRHGLLPHLVLVVLAVTCAAPRANALDSTPVGQSTARDERRSQADSASSRTVGTASATEALAARTRSGDASGHEDVLRDERPRAALERGLAWLASAQASQNDGSFPATGLARREAGAAAMDGSGSFAPVAVTALATLALLAGGSAPDRGPHGHAVALAVDWLVAHTELDARAENQGYIRLGGDTLSRMHGHGFAALALAQAFAISPATDRGARVQTALQAAVDCIQKSQGVDGGWWYEPKSSVQHENSITICAVQALRAAHDVGARVDARTIQRAIEYVSRTQKQDGSFRYALGDDKSSVALTAAAIATLNATGTYGGRTLEDGYDWIFRKLAARADAPLDHAADDFVMCPFYERLYLAQALWQNADAHVFDDWWRTELPRVLTAQQKDGSWGDPRYGDCYATAMNCLVLALPAGLLPIFQR